MAVLPLPSPAPELEKLLRLQQEAESIVQDPSKAYLSLPRLISSSSSSVSFGRQLHALSIKFGLSSDPFVSSSLISLYSSSSLHDVALQLFQSNQPHCQNVVSWTAAISACARSGRPTEALQLFIRMLSCAIIPDAHAFACVLSSSAALGVLAIARAVHGHMVKTGILVSAHLGTALVDAYCKCSCVDSAVLVFRTVGEEAKRSVKLWNAMMHGFAVHGRGAEALQLFDEMTSSGLADPNAVTFVSLLCGCAHCGLVAEGRSYFNAMYEKYRIEPNVKHYGCMVDLLSRAGMLEDAFQMASDMPIPANHVIWGALLSSCRAHGDGVMAARAMERIARLECIPEDDTSHFVTMSKIHKQSGALQKMTMARKLVGKKPRGWSWIEIDGQVHEFGVEAQSI